MMAQKVFTTNELKEKWDSFSKTYLNFAEPMAVPMTVLLMGAIGLTTPNENIKSIIEVGCGAGVATSIALGLKQDETNFTAYDLSNEMLLIAKQRLGITQHDNDQIPSKNFKIKQADAEHLPLDNSSVDRYFSNLCLHLVNDPDQMLRDSYRVLQVGGISTFSVWGRCENSNMFSISGIVAKELGIHLVESGARSPYHLQDLNKLRQMALNAGYSRVQTGYSYFNQYVINGESYVKMHLSTPDSIKLFERIGDEKATEFKNRVAQYVDNLINNGQMIGLEIAFMICFKD